MIIKKFIGKNPEDAIAIAKNELGNNVVVMNVKTLKPKGFFRFFRPASVEVTAALEVNDQTEAPVKPAIVPVEPYSVKSVPQSVTSNPTESNTLEARIDSLQQFLEKQLSKEEKETKANLSTKQESNEIESEMDKKSIVDRLKEEKNGNLSFIKMIYSIMLENEVDEKYANVILDEMEKIMRPDTSIDYILSSIYQKMILKFGQAHGVEFTSRKPKVVFFVGPTGVGKTTTIAKLASQFKLDQGKQVALITADTYRIAATEQLRTYANILDAPLSVIYSPEEMENTIELYKEYDAILIDTAGHSHRNQAQQNEMKLLINSLPNQYEKEVFLVISATTKYKDLLEIVDSYSGIIDYKILFTKLDETATYGNILNIKMYSGADLSYTTNGQNVPGDLEILNVQAIVKQLLGGK